MSYGNDIEILGETVKSALGAQLMANFPGVIWYKDFVTNVRYPHFFLMQLTLSAQEERRGKYFLRYLMTVRYRVEEEPSRNTTLHEALDAVGLRMLSGINNIVIAGIPMEVSGARYEKADGVLHYFCNVTLMVEHEQIEQAKQWQLNFNATIKEEK